MYYIICVWSYETENFSVTKLLHTTFKSGQQHIDLHIIDNRYSKIVPVSVLTSFHLWMNLVRLIAVISTLLWSMFSWIQNGISYFLIPSETPLKLAPKFSYETSVVTQKVSTWVLKECQQRDYKSVIDTFWFFMLTFLECLFDSFVG